MAYKLQIIAGDNKAGNYGYVDSPDPFAARFNNPHDCVLSPDRSCLYIADYGNGKIRKLTLSGTFPVSTLCSAPGVYLLHCNPATGNLWTVINDAGTYKLIRVTPAGTVTVMFTLSDYGADALPDPAERYIRVRCSFGGGFTVVWRLIDVVAGVDLGTVGNDGAYARSAGQMWSPRHPDTYVYTRDYAGGDSTGVSILRAAQFGAPFDYHLNYSPSYYTYKIVPGPDIDPPYETFIGLHQDGRINYVSYDASATSPYISPRPRPFPTGLPAVPGRTLERDQTTGVLYFPLISRWLFSNEGGVTEAGIPINTIAVGVPADYLSG